MLFIKPFFGRLPILIALLGNIEVVDDLDVLVGQLHFLNGVLVGSVDDPLVFSRVAPGNLEYLGDNRAQLLVLATELGCMV